MNNNDMPSFSPGKRAEDISTQPLKADEEELYETPFGSISPSEFEAAQEAAAMSGDRDNELTLHFAKGLCRFFTSKTGEKCAAIKIPGTQFPSWPEFVVPAKNVHNNRYGKGLWMKVSSDANTRLTYSVQSESPDGKKRYERKTVFVNNRKLKEMVESYKKKDPEEQDRGTGGRELPREPDHSHSRSR